MTGSTFAPEPHQKLIDGLNALMLEGQLDKAEALKIIAFYNEYYPKASWLDESVLAVLREQLKLEVPRPLIQNFSAWLDQFTPTEPENRYQGMSTPELEERLGEISYELRPVTLPFRSFGDYQREQKLGLEAGYIEDELGRRS